MFPKACTLLSEAVTWAELNPALTRAVTDKTRVEAVGSDRGLAGGSGKVSVYEAPLPGSHDLSGAVKLLRFVPSTDRLKTTLVIEVWREEVLHTDATT